jgi:hypothetical protein
MEMGIAINMNYGSEDPSPRLDENTPHVYDISFKNISGKGILNAGAFECLKESRCHSIALEDIDLVSIGGFQCIFVASGEAIGNVSPDACF